MIEAMKQELVATLWQHGETGRTRIIMQGDITDCDARWFKAADLYTTPPAQEFVCSTGICHYKAQPAPVSNHYVDGGHLVYTKAQRQWVGLTQQDIDIALDDTWEDGGLYDFARVIEAKLKEKNT